MGKRRNVGEAVLCYHCCTIFPKDAIGLKCPICGASGPDLWPVEDGKMEELWRYAMHLVDLKTGAVGLGDAAR